MAHEDDYERTYMTEGEVLYRHRAMPSRGFHLMMVLTMLFPVAILAFASLAPDAPWFLPFFVLPSWLILLPTWLLFSVLRVAVTKEHVHIQYGLFGPKIPVSAITSCEAVTYDWKKYGGFGIRRGLDGSTAYNLMGDDGRAVRIGWNDEKGKPQITLMSAKDPDALTAAITSARATGVAKPKAARIASPVSKERADELAEAEAQLEAELEAEREAERAENVGKAPAKATVPKP